MQYNHVDRQLSRCAPSLHASPSMRKSSSPPYLPSLAPFPAIPALDYLQRGHMSGLAASAYPYSYVRSTSSPFDGSDDDDLPTRLPSIFSDVCSPDTPSTPYIPSDLFVSASPSPPATNYPSFLNSTPPRPQHIQHNHNASVSSGSVSDSEDSNGSLPGREQAIEILRDDDFEDDHMEDVQQIPPPHSVVALLPRADPPGPLPLDHPTNPMLVSLVPITFGTGADLMGTGSSQIVNTADGFVCTECQRTFPRLNDANRHYSTKHDKPIPCPNPGCRDTFPRRSDYLARHLFCNSACMAKALEIDASPEVPMEWRHRRGTPKSGSIIKSALEKVVKLRIQSNGLRTATITKRA